MDKIELTNAQRDVANAIDTPMAVEACAGSGKTRVLIERCIRAIEEPSGGIDRLLVITFTEKAAAELTARLKQRLSPTLLPKLAGAWIGTFHSFCARVLRSHAPAVGLTPSFRILDENTARLLVQRAAEESFLNLLDCGDKHAAIIVEEIEFSNALGLIEELMCFRWHADQLFETAGSLEKREERLLEAVAHCYLGAKEWFTEHVTRMSAVDFQGLEILTLKLFKKHPDILAQYQKRFRHILVDEYQDTNDIQAKLVSLLFRASSNRLFIVGDPMQSIYRFRGANVSCFDETTKLIQKAGGRCVNLMDNFRSRPGIISFVNRFAGGKLVSARPKEDMPSVTAIVCRTQDRTKIADLRALEADGIARQILKLVEDGGFGFGDIVCLFQAITATQAYEAAFCAYGIPFRIMGGRHLLDRPEVRDIMAALNYASNPDNDTALLAMVRSPLFGLSDDKCALLAGRDGKDFKSAVTRHPLVAPFISKLATAGTHRRPSEIIRLILNDTGYEIFCAHIDPSGTRLANIDRLITMASSLEREAPITLRAFCDFLRMLRSESAKLGDTPAAEAGKIVRCMTVHAAKGIEFPVVILPDLIRRPTNAGGAWVFVRGLGLGLKWRDPALPFGATVPSENYKTMLDKERAEDEVESRRLLYVAMTRARERLILPIHDSEKPLGRWHEWIKPLIKDNKVEIVEYNERSESSEKGESGESSKIDLNLTRLSHFSRLSRLSRQNLFTVSQLESFDRCPQEYYLKYVIGLPPQVILPKQNGGLSADVRGSIIHAVIEALQPGNDPSLDEHIRRQCLAHQVVQDAQTIRELKKPMVRFIRDPIFSELAHGRREVRFDWRFENHIITGKIDWLHETEGGCGITDFKTDRITAPELDRRAATYHLQMNAYALATESAVEKKVEVTRLYFLNIGRCHILPFDGKRRDEGAKRIGEIIHKIVARDFNLGDLSPPCTQPNCTCPYHLNRLCWLDRRGKITIKKHST